MDPIAAIAVKTVTIRPPSRRTFQSGDGWGSFLKMRFPVVLKLMTCSTTDMD
jgi:hypothetical protein